MSNSDIVLTGTLPDWIGGLQIEFLDSYTCAGLPTTILFPTPLKKNGRPAVLDVMAGRSLQHY